MPERIPLTTHILLALLVGPLVGAGLFALSGSMDLGLVVPLMAVFVILIFLISLLITPAVVPHLSRWLRPEPAKDTVPDRAGNGTQPIVSTAKLATLLVVLFGITILGHLLAAAADAALILLLHVIQAGIPVRPATASAADSFQSLTGTLQLLLLIPTGLVFLVWFYRSHKNLEFARVSPLKYPSSAAIWGFFVPIVSLFRPHQVMQEVWRGSQALSPPAGVVDSDPKVTPGLITSWWVLFIASGLIATIGTSLLSSQSITTLVLGEYLLLLSDLGSALAAYFALMIVRAVAAKQGRANARVAPIQPSAA